MPKRMKKRSAKAGLPPGTLIHVGERKTEEPKISVIDYDELSYQEKEAKAVEECFVFKEKATVTWINVEGLHQVEILEKLGECYGIHPLVLEDILNTDQRPKFEDHDSYLYIVIRMLDQNPGTEEVLSEQVSFIVGRNYVISFQEREGDVFNPVRERIRTAKGRLRSMGADYLAYALADAIVDNYFIIVERLGERIDSLEEDLISHPTPEALKTIQHLKREMLFLRRAVWPLRDVISGMERGESSLINQGTVLYLRDVYDHVIQIIDTIETHRERLSEMIDIYLSSVSFRLNEVMKMLTIIATIFMPLTFLAGVYGMNFRNMPELKWPWAYPALWLVMIGVGVSMVLYFRRRKWL